MPLPATSTEDVPNSEVKKSAMPPRGRRLQGKGEKRRAKRERTPRTSVLDRKASPIHTRSRLSENYEEPISGREAWWRSTIKETPNPGNYEYDDFIHDIKRRPNTYGFKAEGRKKEAQTKGRGELLLPGAYQHHDLLYDLERSRTTYAFKDTGRQARDVMNFGRKDKDINVCPTSYGTEKHLTLSVERQPSRHWNFRSQTKRFPTLHFVPKQGPAPGNYDYMPPQPPHAVSSSFKSATPRFSSSHTRVPGPGSYERTLQYPMTRTLAKMGRQHGVFFSSAFRV